MTVLSVTRRFSYLPSKQWTEIILFWAESTDMLQKEAKRCGIEFMGGTARAGPQFLDRREHNQELTLIKDIETEVNITKSVASNLVKHMVQNGLVELEASPSDKRAKLVRLTDKSRSQMQVKALFERIASSLLEGISKEKLAVLKKFSTTTG